MQNKAAIVTQLNLVKQAILDYTNQNPDYFLGAGLLADSLFIYNYSKSYPNQQLEELALSNFEKIYNKLEHIEVGNDLSLIAGYTGLAWLFQYYVNENVFNTDTDFFNYFDDIIIEKCRADASTCKFDLFYGILGYGVYFLQRYKHDPSVYIHLEELVSILERISTPHTKGVYWFCDIFSDQKNKINMGMAHGIPSILVFLAKVYALKKEEKIKQLITQALQWFLQFKNPCKEAITLFPYLQDLSGTDLNHAVTRLAWCYGDLTIGYAVFYAGKTIGNTGYISEGIAILEKCAQRKMTDVDANVRDKAFCHGAAGLYYIFNKLATRHSLNQFAATADYWLQQLIANPAENINAYKSYFVKENETIYAHDYGLINGYVGIGLTLLYALENKHDEWSDIFML